MLTVIQIQNLKPKAKPYKVSDTDGLFILVQPNGSLLWRLKYRIDGREKKLALGKYPQVSLKAAREKRDEARKKIAEGVDPGKQRREAKIKAMTEARNTFRLVADEYIEKMAVEGKSPATISKLRWFRDLLNPYIGHVPVAEVSPHELLAALKRIERRGHHETALRTRSFAGRVFRYAIATLRAQYNHADVLRGALVIPKVRHRSAILEPKKVGELLRAIGDYSGRVETRIGLQLAAHVFLRPGEIRTAEWDDIDLAEAVWHVPAAKMKMKRPHTAPLSRQSVELLRELQSLQHPSTYLFPAFHTPKKTMSENTLNQALRRIGYTNEEMTAHGFRAVASTLLNESGRWHPDAIEKSLAHHDPDRVRSAYNRGTFWDERVRMAQWWSDYLDKLRDGADVVQLDLMRG